MFLPRVLIGGILGYMQLFAPVGESAGIKASELPPNTSSPQTEQCDGGVFLGPASFADSDGGLVAVLPIGPSVAYFRNSIIAGRTLIKTWGWRARGGADVYGEPGHVEPAGDFENGTLVFPTPPGEWGPARVLKDSSYKETRYIPLDDPENYSGKSSVGAVTEAETIEDGLCYEYVEGADPLGASVKWFISKPIARKFGEGQPSMRERGR